MELHLPVPFWDKLRFGTNYLRKKEWFVPKTGLQLCPKRVTETYLRKYHPPPSCVPIARIGATVWYKSPSASWVYTQYYNIIWLNESSLPTFTSLHKTATNRKKHTPQQMPVRITRVDMTVPHSVCRTPAPPIPKLRRPALPPLLLAVCQKLIGRKKRSVETFRRNHSKVIGTESAVVKWKILPCVYDGS